MLTECRRYKSYILQKQGNGHGRWVSAAGGGGVIVGKTDGHCHCDDGWGGSQCEIYQCNHGHSLNSGSQATQCTCDPAWTGDHCDHIVCIHGTPNSVHTNCSCDSGWTGTHCDYIECQHGTPHHYYCACHSGYTGLHCDGMYLVH